MYSYLENLYFFILLYYIYKIEPTYNLNHFLNVVLSLTKYTYILATSLSVQLDYSVKFNVQNNCVKHLNLHVTKSSLTIVKMQSASDSIMFVIDVICQYMTCFIEALRLRYQILYSSIEAGLIYTTAIFIYVYYYKLLK